MSNRIDAKIDLGYCYNLIRLLGRAHILFMVSYASYEFIHVQIFANREI